MKIARVTVPAEIGGGHIALRADADNTVLSVKIGALDKVRQKRLQEKLTGAVHLKPEDFGLSLRAPDAKLDDSEFFKDDALLFTALTAKGVAVNDTKQISLYLVPVTARKPISTLQASGIMSIYGTYLWSDGAGGIAVKPDISAQTQFTFVLSESKLYIRDWKGAYLTSDPYGKVYTAPQTGDWAWWIIEDENHIRSAHSRFLSIDPDGRVSCALVVTDNCSLDALRPVVEGNLQKLASQGARKGRYQSRYFVLSEHKLCYWNVKPKLKEEPKGVYLTSSFENVMAKESSSLALVVLMKNRSMTLQAETSTDRQLWLQALFNEQTKMLTLIGKKLRDPHPATDSRRSSLNVPITAPLLSQKSNHSAQEEGDSDDEEGEIQTQMNLIPSSTTQTSPSESQSAPVSRRGSSTTPARDDPTTPPLLPTSSTDNGPIVVAPMSPHRKSSAHAISSSSSSSSSSSLVSSASSSPLVSELPSSDTSSSPSSLPSSSSIIKAVHTPETSTPISTPISTPENHNRTLEPEEEVKEMKTTIEKLNKQVQDLNKTLIDAMNELKVQTDLRQRLEDKLKFRQDMQGGESQKKKLEEQYLEALSESRLMKQRNKDYEDGQTEVARERERLAELARSLDVRQAQLTELETKWRARDKQLEKECQLLNQKIMEYNKRAKDLNKRHEDLKKRRAQWKKQRDQQQVDLRRQGEPGASESSTGEPDPGAAPDIQEMTTTTSDTNHSDHPPTSSTQRVSVSDNLKGGD